MDTAIFVSAFVIKSFKIKSFFNFMCTAKMQNNLSFRLIDSRSSCCCLTDVIHLKSKVHSNRNLAEVKVS